VVEAKTDRDNFCYRHPNRASFVLCQRCGRTICADCQTQAPVGVHCPECVKEARQNAPRGTPALVRAARAAQSSSTPVVTYSLIGINLIVYIIQWLSGDAVFEQFAYWPPLTATEPWRMVTTMFLHSQQFIPHVLLNMYSLFVIGPILEQTLGRGRFLALYLIAGFGGSVGVLLLAPNSIVVGASGAIFGLLGALFVIQRRLGGNTTQLLIVIGINLVIGFVIPGLAWQAHLGGLLVGAGIGAIYVRTRRIQLRSLQVALVAAVAAVLVAVSVLRVLIG
jgi:membrane associated rhomboid family serine protease